MSHSNGTSEPTRYYLRCQVEPGMFADEFLAKFEGADPKAQERRMVTVQLLVDGELLNLHGKKPVRGKPIEGELIVELVRQVRDWAVVALPQPGLPVGNTAVVQNQLLAQML